MNDQLQSADAPDLIAAQAEELIDRRRFFMARNILGPALLQHPDHVGLLYQMARSEVIEHNCKVAPDVLSRLLALKPDHDGARLLLFFIEMQAGHLAEAERIILDLLRASPRQPVYYANYSRLMLRAMDFAKARRLVDEALRISPNLDYALQTRVLCDIVDGRSGLDSGSMKQLLMNSPDDARTLRLVTVSLVHSGRSRQALRLAQELLRGQPNDAGLLKLVKTLSYSNHWSMLPLLPLRKWGWAASAGTWVLMLVVVKALQRWAPAQVMPVSLFWLAFVVYSWVWPTMLKKILRIEQA